MAAEATSSELSALETELISRVHSFFPNSEPDKFYFFYETASPFSNFHPCSFEENGLVFTSSEKYMMYRKAKLFGDEQIAGEILRAEEPADCKALGRKVNNFSSPLWVDHRTPIVSQAVYLKFTQNEHLKKALLEQRGNLLVEAAAKDRVWGVGMTKDNPRIQKRANWKGLNLLGYILTDVLQRIYEGK